MHQDPLSTWNRPDTNLVFLCGFPSSGTDLLKNVMNAHPDICIRGEFPFLPNLARRYGAIIPRAQGPEVVAAIKRLDVYHNLGQPELELPPRQADYVLSELYAAMLTEKPYRWTGNKTPQNTEHIAQLHDLFPQAKFILIVRDVRDVALSWGRKWGKDMALCAHKWQTRMRQGRAMLQGLDEDAFLVLKYEDLLGHFPRLARRICEFLGVEFHANLLTYHDHVTQVVAGKRNYGKALVANNVNKWIRELSSQDIRRIEEVAFGTLQSFNYPITLAPVSRPLKPYELWFGYLLDVASLLMIGNRVLEQNRLRYRCQRLWLEVRKFTSRMRSPSIRLS